MAEAAVKTVIDKISQGHLECPICFCRFKDPKSLKCMHSFCLNCLNELVSKTHPEKDKITCPVCRKVTAVPSTGLHGLASNFAMGSLVDEVNKQEKQLGDTSVSALTCEECDEGLPAVSRCLDCNENICQKCQEAHRRLKYTKNHSIVPVEDLHSIGEAPAKTEKADTCTPKCKKHVEEDVSCYCDTCKLLICAKCATLDHLAPKHKCGEIAEAVESYREFEREIFEKLIQYKSTMKTLENSMEHSRGRLKMMAERACREISEKEEEQVGQIRYKSCRLKEAIAKITEERDELYERVIGTNRDQVDRAELIATAVKDKMERANDYEVLERKAKAMHNLQFQESLQIASHGFSFLGVRCYDVVEDTNLGKILCEEKWRLVKTFGKGRPGDSVNRIGVACFRNGDFAVTDLQQGKLVIYSSTGRYKRTLEGAGGVTEAFCVAVTSDDLLLVTDVKDVKVFDVNLQKIRQFQPSHADSDHGQSESHLAGIAVDKKKRVAVSDIVRKVIYLGNFDGSLIKSIPIDFPGIFLALSCKERLVFSNSEDSRLLCVDFSGNEVFNVSLFAHGPSARPTGVCCDEAGDIYVGVVYPQRGASEVHHYDPEGKHVGLIISGLSHALGMTFNPSGDLVVADRNSFKIFHRI